MLIKLLDGSLIEAEKGSSVLSVATQISEGLARNALIGKVDGNLVDLNFVLTKDCTLEIITAKSEEGMSALRHTCAHILAQAVKNIFPTVMLGFGPDIKNGFYYDFDFATPITLEDFPKIEKEMEAIIKADFPLERVAVSRKKAITLMQGYNELYKVQMIEELPLDAEISIYKQGSFTDVCRGPHLVSTGKVKNFKLTQLAGAYWKGSEKNKMLTRIYGTAFDKKAELTAYLEQLEEAKKRDHNKLGRELGYFMTDENIGQGLPLLMPKGARIVQALQRFVEDEEERRGYLLTKTPLMAKSDLYKISGHWDHYRDGMFIIGDESKDDEVLALRPMTCPFQYTIYNNGLKSYRDLPCRYGETSTLFRKESSGEMHGLIRVRHFTISEGHIVCMPSQLEEEFKGCIELAKYVLTCIGLIDDISFRFSKWDPSDKGKYIDDPATWAAAENTMKNILDHLGVKYTEAIGEAAFYGPKLDIQIKNVWGKEDTLITIQVDMFLAKNFDMNYIDENGEKKRPYIIHRTSLGCYERTFALLIEKFAGAMPLWFAPLQVKVLSLTDRTIDNANQIVKLLQSKGIKAEADNRSEKIGYKIREAQLGKVPYMLIIGDKEAADGVVAVRDRIAGDLGSMSVDSFIEKIREEIDNKIIRK